MLYSAIIIHISGGRIETHFHIFGSLAFLSFYRDPKILITATITVGLDHLLRGIYFPYSVYGVNIISPFRWIEHVAWVLFEDVFLVIAILHRTKVDYELSNSQAILECNNEITQKKIIDATYELKGSVRLAHELINQSNQIIFLLDTQGVIINYNNSANKYFKLNKVTSLGVKFWDLPIFSDSEKSNIKELFHQSSINITTKFEVETIIDNKLYFIDFSIKPITGLNKQINYMLVEGYDTTTIKEAKLHISNFCSTISHELRSPLTSIKGVLGLLEGGLLDLDDASSHELIQAASSSCDNLILIVNDILDLRKIEAGKLDLKLEPVAIEELVDSAINNTKNISPEKNLQFIKTIHCSDFVIADKLRIIQVLTNLLTNAIKFSYENTSITLNVYSIENKVYFEVINQGIGIDEDKLNKIFDPFYQIDSSDEKIMQGSGLGLAICKALIQQHEGNLLVKSVPKQLTTFYFDLNKESNPDNLGKSCKTPTNSILIIEDDFNLLNNLKLILESSGYSVYTASTLAQTKNILKDITPNLIVLDINLPDGCGLSLIEKNNLKSKIMIISGEKKNLNNNFNFIDIWLEKPFNYETFIKSINEIILKKNAPQLLIVDDDPKLTKVIEKRFKLAGFNCKIAHNGSQALEIIKSCQPDLIILDIFMPEMNGIELLDNLKSGNLDLNPIIIYSGHDLSQVDKEKLTNTTTYFLTKSQHKENDLLELSNKILSKDNI